MDSHQRRHFRGLDRLDHQHVDPTKEKVMQRKNPFKVIGAIFSLLGVLAVVFVPAVIQDCRGERPQPPPPPTVDPR
jgi:hypothetical protein